MRAYGYTGDNMVCRAIYNTLFWRYANIMSGLKIALLIVWLEVKNSKMASNRKQTNLESIQRRKITMLPNLISVLTICNMRLENKYHQWHNKFVTKSAKWPTHTSVPWRFLDVFYLFLRNCLNKLFIQYIRYIDDWTYCIISYWKNLPNTHP